MSSTRLASPTRSAMWSYSCQARHRVVAESTVSATLASPRPGASTTHGALAARPELDRVLDQLRPDGALAVWKLDRLGRSLRHLVDTVTALADRGIGFGSGWQLGLSGGGRLLPASPAVASVAMRTIAHALPRPDSGCGPYPRVPRSWRMTPHLPECEPRRERGPATDRRVRSGRRPGEVGGN